MTNRCAVPVWLMSLLLAAAAPAAAAELKLELPKTSFLLRQEELPLMQREAQALPTENDFIQRLAPLLNEQKIDQALTALRGRYKEVTELLEAGDSRDEARLRVVPGSAFAPPKPGTISAALMYLMGSAYQINKNNAAAEAAYKAALSVMPDYIRVHESLGILYLFNDRLKDALTHLSRAVQLGLSTPNLYGALGYVNFRLENHFGAASAFQNAMMLEPANEQWQRGLLSALAASRQSEAGLTLAEQMLKSRPNDVDLWIYRSELELQAGRKPQGLSSLEAAIRLGNDEAANLQVAAALHLDFGSVDRAVALLRVGVGKGLDFRYVDQGMQSLMAREQWVPLQRLLDEYKSMTGLNDSQQSRVLLRRASLSQHNNDSAQARTQLQQAITLDPANGEALLLLGQLQHKDKNYAQAELLLQRATAYNTVAEIATLMLAQVAIDQHEYGKALKLLRDVHAANPNRTDLARNIEALESLTPLVGGN